MNYHSVDPGTPEWMSMWAHLRRITLGDGEDLNPESNERWQYMGTWPDPDPPPADFLARLSGEVRLAWPRWVHSFRHRDLPGRGRLNLYLYPSEEYLATLPPPRYAPSPPGFRLTPRGLEHPALCRDCGDSLDPRDHGICPVCEELEDLEAYG